MLAFLDVTNTDGTALFATQQQSNDASNLQYVISSQAPSTSYVTAEEQTAAPETASTQSGLELGSTVNR